MIQALTEITVCLILGDAMNRVTGLPVPGPVIGMLLLLALLLVRRGPDHGMRQTCNGLLQNMALLFVPASTGLITELPLLNRDAWPIAAAILSSTVLGMAATGAAMHVLTRGER
jgi:holin-like protein